MTGQSKLILEDGTEIVGDTFGRKAEAAGEVVFNTGMVGYPETLTDPSYSGQILVMTYPLAGNYGVPEFSVDDNGLPIGFESDRIQVAGLVVSEHSVRYSHHNAVRSLEKWLEEEGVPGLFNVDTRSLTRHLRDKGSMLGKIETETTMTNFFDPNTSDLASRVCIDDVTELSCGDSSAPKVVLIDCGCKANIIRSLLNRGLNVVRVPHNHYFLNLDYDGLVISNGPGDPKMFGEATRNVERALAVGKPILGVCLGNQVLARAVGADTFKLKFGHRSHNQPCVELALNPDPEPRPTRREPTTGRCVITSQNHGFAVRRDGLPDDWRVWFANANDGTVEGIRHVSKPFQAVQFHPEAKPGPVDTAWIFDDFVAQVKR
ncbi:glutamine-hydrolyzing carbamoyl-phosphate synthase small subunit [candidate division GN15 bacterium]|nr:glutamine-hydrolyzing carbamoyl-phosphate synthase small subunit [candidate division GN15 bacterium]